MSSSYSRYFIFYIRRGVGGQTDASYNFVSISAGQSFMPGQIVRINGALLGGTTPTNDVTFQITEVSSNGSILNGTPIGTAIPTATILTYGPFHLYPTVDVPYARNLPDIRDASDWITSKKQVLLAKTADRDANRRLLGPNGETISNEYRLNIKEGILNNHAFGCTGCFGGAFNGN
jgi:hypothetical protein